jgi:hypothetical protein
VNLYWKLKLTMRKQDEPKSSLMIRMSRVKDLEWYECNRWGIGYWNHRQKEAPPK